MRLVPMTEADYAAYLERLLPEYAAEHVRAGNWPAEHAETMAQAQLQAILPDGLHTPDHYLYLLRVEGETDPVGQLWLGVMRQGGAPRAFIYDIEIYERFRRRGYATQALQAAEAQARELGLSSIALHVFGHNTGARALYEKQGYAVTDVVMAKDL
ncbi:MAG: GNAT family N-acetyltransferase [Chloroflexi bacterium]|jgi:RimJ/RimL family protein N-acetyltransferase|nr:GNAT family N-acetyltransferase [Chloroflexota bacterium]